MSTSSSSDIVLPMIQSHNGKSYTAGVVRKKSTPKIISTRRHFELYGRGDQRLGSKMFVFRLTRRSSPYRYRCKDDAFYLVYYIE